MSDTQPAKTPVYCPHCGGFMFHIVITMQSPPIGSIGGIEDFKCPNRRCGYKTNVMIGVADRSCKGDRKTVEGELKRQIQQQKDVT